MNFNCLKQLTSPVLTMTVLIALAVSLVGARNALAVCGTPGKDGPFTGGGVVNSYFASANSANAGDKIVSLSSSPRADGAQTGISVGDMLMLWQTQGADISSTNDAAYGSGVTANDAQGYTNLNSAGYYEFVRVTSVAGGTIGVAGDGAGGGLLYSYSYNLSAIPRQTFQVIRVPQYSSMNLTSALLPVKFDGTTGGGIVVDVSGNISFNTTTAASVYQTGFRGGFAPINDGVNSNSQSVYPIPTRPRQGAGKGEGIAGRPRFVWDETTSVDYGTEGYPGGDGGRGAPGNAGGGGNAHNAGGGGGSNSGAGGRGGYPWEGQPSDTGTLTDTVTNTNGTTRQVPRAWGQGAVALRNGGAVFTNRLFMGGGGGGGDANNATTGVKGGVGGGVVILRAGSFSGITNIDARGDAGDRGAFANAPDGAGGGGAGGTVMLISRKASSATITVNGQGGAGGNTANDPTDPGSGANSGTTAHGPGGGGGGGTVLYSPGLSVTADLSGGAAGKTNDGGTGTISHGAAPGASGLVSTIAAGQGNGLTDNGDGCTATLTLTKITTTPSVAVGASATYQITITNTGTGGAAGAVVDDVLPVPFTYDPASPATIAYGAGASGPATLAGTNSTATSPTGSVTTTRFGTAGGDATTTFFIGAGANIKLTFPVKTNAAAPGKYDNSASVSFGEPSRTNAATLVTPGGTYANGTTVAGANYNGALAANTAEDVAISPPLSGVVYEDINFAGKLSTANGGGRDFDSAKGMKGVNGARVELFNADGSFNRFTTTATVNGRDGVYSFAGVATGAYYVRVVNSSVASTRGGVAGLLPVQTFQFADETNDNANNATAFPNRVGGRFPALSDAAANTTNAALNTTTFALGGGFAQSVSRAEVRGNSAPGVTPTSSGLAFGFNFDMVVNTGDAGQGSLRQFILNSNALSNTGLAQDGLTPGNETSIFSIPSASDPLGRAADANYGGALARIVLGSALPSITGANAGATVINGRTQTALGNTNTAQVGLNSNVGLGALSVSTVEGPEIEITGNGALNNLLTIAADDVAVRGVAITGQNGAAAANSGQGAILLSSGARALVTDDIFGVTTNINAIPSAQTRVSDAVSFGTGANSDTTIRANVFAQIGRRAILAGAFQATPNITRLLIEGNLISTTGSQMAGSQGDGEGLILFGSYQDVTIRGNLFDKISTGNANGYSDNGIEVFFNVAGSAAGATGLLIDQNTIRNTRGVGISLADSSATGGPATDGTNSAGKTIRITGNSITATAVGAGNRGGNGIEVSGARGVRITQNSFSGNDKLAIDLGSAFGSTVANPVSPNDGLLSNNDTAAGNANNKSGNNGIDYPIFTSLTRGGANALASGTVGLPGQNNAAFGGVTVEVYLADNVPANQNGPTTLTSGDSQPHGEGLTFLGTTTADSNGNFSYSVPNNVLTGARALTAIAISGNGNTSEFGTNFDASGTVNGTVYLDANRNGALDGAETGTGLNNLFVKAVPAGQNAATQAVAVNASSGAFQFLGLSAGNYTLVLSNNATLSDVTPAIPPGYVGTQAPNGTRQLTVGNQPVLDQNFGLYSGAQILGSVYEDNGIGGGIANDGVKNGGETALAGVKLNLTTNTGTVIDTTTTDASGNFTFRVPNSVASSALKIVEVNPPDYVSTGATAGNTSGTYDRPSDAITFNYTAGATYSGLSFGDVRGAVLTGEDAKTGTLGSSVAYAHVFRAQTAGTVTFSASQLASPNNPDWSVVAYRDSNNNGQLDGADAQLGTAPISVAAGQQITVFLQNFVPTTAANGAQDKLTISATFTASGTGAPPVQVLSRSDLTTVATNQGLSLTKTVDKATAKSGDVLLYTITYRNTGADVLTNLVVNDATPAYTTFVSAADGTRPAGLTGVTIAAPGAGAKGPVKWTFVGGLNPGQSGTVTFQVKVD